MKDYERLEVWQWSHALTLALYSTTRQFPKEEAYGFTSQMRRAVVSIPANIAEGCGRATDADFKRFLDIAYGSAAELSYYVTLARDLGYLSAIDHHELSRKLTRIRKMLAGLIRRLRSELPAKRSQPAVQCGLPAAGTQQPTAKSRQPIADRR